MSQWLEEQAAKTGESRVKSAPTIKNVIAVVVVFVLLEAFLLILNQVTPEYDTSFFCVIVGIVGLGMAGCFYMKLKSSQNNPKLPFAQNCLQAMNLSAEEVRQFDEEMTADPLVFIQNGKRLDSAIAITEHYMRAAFLYRNEIDYGIFRLSDIDMAYSETTKNPVIIKPRGRIFDVLLYNGKGERMGGVSMQNEKDYKQFLSALEKYAPHIRLNVSAAEVQKAAAENKK